MNESNLTIFKKGALFGFGFGLVVSTLFVVVAYVGFYSFVEKNEVAILDDNMFSDESRGSEGKNGSGIEIVNFRDIKNGNYTYIVGSYKNTSNATVSSVKFEAEFFDKDGNFVWQEHESIYKNIEPNETQHFAIKCGCHDHSIPEYSKVIVNVVE
jgi:hypothetical protein